MERSRGRTMSDVGRRTVMGGLATASLVPTAALAQGARPTLTVAMPVIFTSHVATQTTNFATRVTQNIYDRLIERDWLGGSDGGGIAPKPALATAWKQISPTVLELTLRPNVKFHNGETMTAEDVAFTLSAERLWGPKPSEPFSFASTIGAVEIVDPLTVRIVTKQPDPVLVQRLMTQMSMVVPKKHYLEVGVDKFGQAPIGTGPYKWSKLVPGEYLQLSAFDEYWGGKPPLEHINYRVVPETSARIAGLLTGEFDITTSVPPNQVAVIQRDRATEVRSTQVENVHLLMFRSATPGRPVHDKRVRQAMGHAIDRQLLVDRLWNGLTTVPTTVSWPYLGDYYDAARKPRAYDPQRAKQLLDEAGYKGEQIILRNIANYYLNMDRAIQVMLEMWKKVGLNVKLEFVENMAQMGWGTADVVAISNNFEMPDPLAPLWTSWGAPDGFFRARGHWAPPQAFLDLGQTLQTSFDKAERRTAYQKMLDIWEDETPAILLYRPVESYGVRKNIAWRPYTMYWMDFRGFNVRKG